VAGAVEVPLGSGALVGPVSAHAVVITAANDAANVLVFMLLFSLAGPSSAGERAEHDQQFACRQQHEDPVSSTQQRVVLGRGE
jgi:hypothetical protein